MNDDKTIALGDDEAKQLVAIAGEILAGRLEILDGCSRMATELMGEDTSIDPDFEFVVSLHLASAHLPIGRDRDHWNAEILAKKDQEIAALTARHRDDVLAVCQRIIERYSTR